MKTTVVGDHENFAAASRAAAELMIAGFTQAQISIVGRDVVAGADGASRFAFAGAVARVRWRARRRTISRIDSSSRCRTCAFRRARRPVTPQALARGGGLRRGARGRRAREGGRGGDAAPRRRDELCRRLASDAAPRPRARAQQRARCLKIVRRQSAVVIGPRARRVAEDALAGRRGSPAW